MDDADPLIWGHGRCRLDSLNMHVNPGFDGFIPEPYAGKVSHICKLLRGEK